MTRVFGWLLTTLFIGWPRRPRPTSPAFSAPTPTPDSRRVKGVALGSGILVLGFEFEYAATTRMSRADAPSLKSGMGNVLLQTPVAIFGLQPYFTTGGGVYRERLASHEETGIRLEHGRRREDFARRAAAAAPRLPGVQTGERCALLAVTPLLRRTQFEVLTVAGSRRSTMAGAKPARLPILPSQIPRPRCYLPRSATSERFKKF